MLTASAGAFPGLADALGVIEIDLESRPLLSFEPPDDWGPLDDALKRRHRYHAVALTSPRASHSLAERIGVSRITWDENAPPVWVVGSATEARLGGRVGRVRKLETPPHPGDSAAASLARAMLEVQVKSPVLFPCGNRRRDELPELLQAHGVQVDEVVCYRSVLASREEARAAVAASTLLVVASPSVAQLLAEAWPEASRPQLVVIGAATAEAAQAAGWPAASVSAEPSTAALATAITGLLASR